MTDIEIARQYKIKPIAEIASAAGIAPEAVEPYGKYKCKVDIKPAGLKGRLVLVTAMNPTPLGEGKTTVSIGLMDALKRQGRKIIGALREPSLGPVFGIKGGACGGGWSQVVPMEEINLHFTGDLHAVTTANNLLSAIIDNHIHQGNLLDIDPERVVFRRSMDMNDRNLRNITTGQGKPSDGVTMHTGFDITAASEVMAILCLSLNLKDLKTRLGNITVGYNRTGRPVTASELKAENAMAILLKEALKPNLVQTLEGTPVFIHGGPFANIAHGCNSVIATRAALSLADYCVTEAGFGADLGAEKFLDVKCRLAGLKPSCAVLVVSIRSLKYNGGVSKENLTEENLSALSAGFRNAAKHIENLKGVFGVQAVIAVNRFPADTDAEIAKVTELASALNVKAIPVTAFRDGGTGAEALAKEVIRLSETFKPVLNYAYSLDETIEQKITAIVTKVYGGKDVKFSEKALADIAAINASGLGNLPVIIAKSQYSLSDNPKELGRPEGFTFNVREVRIKSGAGFIVAIAGDMMLMPGLPKIPMSEFMTIDDDGNITGLS